MTYKIGGQHIHGPAKDDGRSTEWRCSRCKKIRWSVRQPKCHGMKMEEL